MKNSTLGGFSSIDAFVDDKLKRFSESNKDLRALFEFMFAERSNVMFERSAGYRIVSATYGEVRERILRRAAVLGSRLESAAEGSVIGLYIENSAEWIELFWAILACGFRPLLMNMRLGRESLEQALDSVGAAAVIAADDNTRFSRQLLLLSELEPGADAPEPERFGESLFVMSSGTSAHVKVCEYSGEEFYHTIADSAEIIRRCPAMKKHYSGRLKQLAFLPFCHIFGLVAVYLWFGFFSRTFVLLKDYSPATLMDTIRRHEVTHIFAVPLFWNRVYDEAVKAIKARGEATEQKFLKGMRISRKLSRFPALARAFRKTVFREVREGLFGESISFMISGGSEIKPEVLEFFNCIGYRLANGYGMTEIGITSVELSDRLDLLSSGSVGLPFSSLEYRTGENSELFVKGPSAAKRIFEGGRVFERGEWFATGDIAELRGGRWYLAGRMDDLVISPTGENLNPGLIEDKLRVPGVRELALISLRENGLISPTLAVSVNPLLDCEGARAVYEGLRETISQNGLEGQISGIKLLRDPLIGENEFKLNRRRIAERIADGSLKVFDPFADARGGSPDDGLVQRIIGIFADVLGKDASEIAPDADFFLDEGGSSLDFFTVAARLQDEFGYRLPADQERTLSRPCDIADYLRHAANGD